jgi:hypothetical protein
MKTKDETYLHYDVALKACSDHVTEIYQRKFSTLEELEELQKTFVAKNIKADDYDDENHKKAINQFFLGIKRTYSFRRLQFPNKNFEIDADTLGPKVLHEFFNFLNLFDNNSDDYKKTFEIWAAYIRGTLSVDDFTQSFQKLKQSVEKKQYTNTEIKEQNITQAKIKEENPINNNVEQVEFIDPNENNEKNKNLSSEKTELNQVNTYEDNIFKAIRSVYKNNPQEAIEKISAVQELLQTLKVTLDSDKNEPEKLDALNNFYNGCIELGINEDHKVVSVLSAIVLFILSVPIALMIGLVVGGIAGVTLGGGVLILEAMLVGALIGLTGSTLLAGPTIGVTAGLYLFKPPREDLQAVDEYVVGIKKGYSA